jgi:pyridoxine 5-phosphate synthase
MTKLSVNVNKLATLRNSRGKNNPDVQKGALDIIQFGGEGITVHPRPDERHIRRSDVYGLKSTLVGEFAVEFNIEGYPSDDFIALLEKVQPAQATLVPDPPEVLTSNAGWNVRANSDLLSSVAARLAAKGVRVSVFVDPQTMQDDDYRLLRSLGVDRVELYTEAYAESHGTPQGSRVLQTYVQAAQLARAAGLGVNAGHDLNLDNLTDLISAIPWIDEVSIGHALICDALSFGMRETIRRYRDCIRRGAELTTHATV